MQNKVNGIEKAPKIKLFSDIYLKFKIDIVNSFDKININKIKKIITNIFIFVFGDFTSSIIPKIQKTIE